MIGALPACRVCGADGGRVFFECGPVPVFCNVLHAALEAARAADRGRIALAWCPRCGMIRNVAFEPRRVAYAPGYENALDHSEVFRAYAEETARRLVDDLGLRGRAVVEIGCGQGRFLADLVAAGAESGIGFDPSFDADRAALPDGVAVRRAAFDGTLDGAPALVVCRHVLEHIDDPVPFLAAVRDAMPPDATAFFEVPNAEWTIERLGVWDVIYEHCSYFAPCALANVFRAAGFDPVSVERTYGGQFLTVRVRPATPAAPLPPPAALAAHVEAFAAAYAERVETWRRRLAGSDGPLVIWGGGSKGVTFLNALGLDPDRVTAVVDVNPDKRGRFVPGTGQPVVAPESLRENPPRQVVVMNPLYRDEIAGTLERLGLAPTLLAA